MKRIGTLVLLILFLLTGCASRYTLDPTPYASHPFDTSYIAYLGQPSEDVARELEESGETWEYLRNDAGELNPRPNLAEPVEVLGDYYMLYVRLNHPPYEMYEFGYEREFTTSDSAERDREIRELYTCMKDVLGEPEQMTYGSTPDVAAYQNGSYDAWWVLDEGIHMAANQEPEMTLCCRMYAAVQDETTLLRVSYTLYRTDQIDWLVGYPGAEGKYIGE